MIPIISISGNVPVMLGPLAIVLIVSMIKDIFEDCKRHRSDNQENMKNTRVFNEPAVEFRNEAWRHVKVGQIVQVNCDEFFPADMVLLKSSEVKGLCYVETKNLDGETNLKHKIVEKNLNKYIHSLGTNFNDLKSATLICENPNTLIYKFEGSLTVKSTVFTLNAENIVLRGSSLKNTEYIIGLVVYTGHQTKIMMNSSNSKYKPSKIESITNRQIIFIICA
jgi:phospholipid-transporting ATPase